MSTLNLCFSPPACPVPEPGGGREAAGQVEDRVRGLQRLATSSRRSQNTITVLSFDLLIEKLFPQVEIH